MASPGHVVVDHFEDLRSSRHLASLLAIRDPDRSVLLRVLDSAILLAEAHEGLDLERVPLLVDLKRQRGRAPILVSARVDLRVLSETVLEFSMLRTFPFQRGLPARVDPPAGIEILTQLPRGVVEITRRLLHRPLLAAPLLARRRCLLALELSWIPRLLLSLREIVAVSRRISPAVLQSHVGQRQQTQHVKVLQLRVVLEQHAVQAPVFLAFTLHLDREAHLLTMLFLL